MRTISSVSLAILLCGVLAVSAAAQRCPDRPAPGSEVLDPLALHSQSGVLQTALTLRNMRNATGQMEYCYNYQGVEAPTLRLNPGDELVIDFKNALKGLDTTPMAGMQHAMSANAGPTDDAPCTGTMTASSSNIHFHGLNVPAKCHGDEVVFTLVNPSDPPFRYRMRIPLNEPPGIYWYHPHPHGMTQFQVMGGASGAIVIEGIEKIKPEVAGLTERIFVLRDQLVPSGGDPDASNMTINFVPATAPATAPPVITMTPGEKQFWRVVNAEAETFVAMQLQVNGVPQTMRLISLDGVPMAQDQIRTTISLPPAGRAEFIVIGPPAGTTANLVTLGADLGPDGDPNPPHPIAKINSGTNAATRAVVRSNTVLRGARRFSGLANQAPRLSRTLYFSEDLSDANNPKFFITVEGQTQKQFDPNDPPAIVTQQGTVEDWTVENRTRETHAFHIHQVHFMLMERTGTPVPSKNVQDTVDVPAWDGQSPHYPSVRIRLDFRDRESVGTYVYHCHILDHEDGGMMAKIEVDPK